MSLNRCFKHPFVKHCCDDINFVNLFVCWEYRYEVTDIKKVKVPATAVIILTAPGIKIGYI